VSALIFVTFGFLIGLPLSWLAIHIGRRVGLLDVPHGIKVHRQPIPYTGGAAIAATLAIGALVFGLPPTILLGGLVIWLIGFVDDLRGLPPQIKLLLQLPPLIVGALDLGLEPQVLMVAVALGVFLVNCFNVIDGLDGLAGGVALISFLAMMSHTSATGVATAGILVGAISAFLVFNLHPARLFLGDQGSLLMGYFLWILNVANYAQNRDTRELLLGALFWGFPLVNAAFVLAKRLMERRALLVGDRGHLYDVLHARLGLRSTLIICWSITAISSIAAVALLDG
jgi:UDP-GlcNAc:undecaprenyl-phosphate GlcNAc-1-phosphate transferase